MVKVTLEFATVDAAIVGLAKFVGGKAARAAQSVGATGATPSEVALVLPVAESPTAAPATTRKGRNDKGKPRGPRTAAPEAAPAPAAESTPVSGTPAETPPAPPVAASPTAGDAPSAEEAQAALAKLFEAPAPKGGIEQARAVMGRFGVTRLRDLPADKRGEFVTLVEKVLAGEAP